MSSDKPVVNPNRKPRRGLSAEERADLFREFKLGLCALAALTILVITLCWDRGRSTDERAARPAAPKANLNLVWRAPAPPDHALPPKPPEPPRGEGAPAPINNRLAPPPSAPVPPDQRLRPPPPNVPPPSAPGGEYVVRKGDNPWKIARKALGDGRKAQLIVDANPGVNPKKLKIGTVLRLPPAAPAARPLPASGQGHTAMVSATVPAEDPDAAESAAAPAAGDGTQVAQALPGATPN